MLWQLPAVSSVFFFDTLNAAALAAKNQRSTSKMWRYKEHAGIKEINGLNLLAVIDQTDKQSLFHCVLFLFAILHMPIAVWWAAHSINGKLSATVACNADAIECKPNGKFVRMIKHCSSLLHLYSSRYQYFNFVLFVAVVVLLLQQMENRYWNL